MSPINEIQESLFRLKAESKRSEWITHSLENRSMCRFVSIMLPMLATAVVYCLIFSDGKLSHLLLRSSDAEWRRSVIVFNRSELPHDEFYKRPRTESALSEYFNFDEAAIQSSNFQLSRMWSCLSKDAMQSSPERFHDRQQKLVFLHISRSAGSTIRALLRAYANFCTAGIALVNQCIDLGVEFLGEHDIWSNGKGSHAAGTECRLSNAIPRGGNVSVVNATYPQVSTAMLKLWNVDILAGAVPLGCLDQEFIDVQYVVFFRDPLSKFVSEFIPKIERLYGNEVVLKRALELINSFVDTQMNSKYTYMKYREKSSNYIVTPEQKAFVEREGIEWTPERRVNLTLKNLYTKRVMVGIVDEMPASLQLLKFMVDRTDRIDTLFQFFSSEEGIAKVSSHLLTRNVTTKIVKQINQDKVLLSKLKEYLKYEQQIYDHALSIHSRQYEMIQIELNA